MSNRVLISDRDEFLLSSYRDCLSRAGFDVASATTGLECMAKLRNFQPDALVLELELLWGGGDGVLAMMYEERDVPLVPVLVLANRNDSHASSHILGRMVVSHYHVKPLGSEQLAKLVHMLLDEPPLERTKLLGRARKRPTPRTTILRVLKNSVGL